MSPFIDRHGRIFGKVSLVDIVIVLAVVVLVLLAFVRFSKPSVAQVPVITTLAIEKVRDQTVKQLKEGVEVQDEGGVVLGKIETIQVSPTPIDVPKNIDSTDPTVPSPGDVIVEGYSAVYKDIVITIRGSGYQSSGAISINGLLLRVGKPLVIIGRGFEVKTTVQQVEVVNG